MSKEDCHSKRNVVKLFYINIQQNEIMDKKSCETLTAYITGNKEGKLKMKISTKGRYALRLMLDLAIHNTGEYITIKSIAKRQEISEKYLEQIITLLSRAGYVRSTRGAQGGYRLSKEPREYTVGMILRLTEGSLAPVACLEDEENECTRASTCATIEVWEKLRDAINGVIDHITLADLVASNERKQGHEYNI